MTMNPGGNHDPILARIAFEYTGGPGGGAQAPGGAVNPEMIGQGADARAKARRTEKREESNTDNSDKQTKILSNHLRSTLGINFGIAAILKQSQIFTGTLGAVFQILGAMVDVVLMAFMPIIVPAIKLLAKNIPGIKAAADRMVGWIKYVADYLKENGGFLKRFFDSKFGSVLKGIFHYFIVTLFLARLMGVHGILLGALKGGLNLVVLGVKALLFPLLGISRNTAATAVRGGMHPGGGGYGAPAGRAAARGRGGMGMMGMGLGAGMLALSGTGAYMAGGMGAGGLGGSIGGAAFGAAVGLALGGPAGAMIGANIGAVAGPIIGGYVEKGVEHLAEGTRERHEKLLDGRPGADRFQYSTPQNNPGGWYEEGYDSRGRPTGNSYQ